MKKNTKIVILVSLVILVGISIFISKVKFGVTNPISVINGLYQICFTDTEYIEIQASPKVMIVTPTSYNDLLIEYMESQGYSESEEERFGSYRKFTQAEHWVYVDVSVNGFYSLWKWKE